jgi:hypothetical protein
VLLDNPDSLFYSMVQQTGTAAPKLIATAKEALEAKKLREQSP